MSLVGPTLLRLHYRWRLPFGPFYGEARMRVETQRAEQMLVQLAQAPEEMVFPRDGSFDEAQLRQFAASVAAAKRWAAQRFG